MRKPYKTPLKGTRQNKNVTIYNKKQLEKTKNIKAIKIITFKPNEEIILETAHSKCSNGSITRTKDICEALGYGCLKFQEVSRTLNKSIKAFNRLYEFQDKAGVLHGTDNEKHNQCVKNYKQYYGHDTLLHIGRGEWKICPSYIEREQYDDSNELSSLKAVHTKMTNRYNRTGKVSPLLSKFTGFLNDNDILPKLTE